MIIIKSQDGKIISKGDRVQLYHVLTEKAKDELEGIRRRIMEKTYYHGSTRETEIAIKTSQRSIKESDKSYVCHIYLDGNFMGEYETEERAKEVLEMIENHIDNILHEKQYTNESRTADFNWIFTMPKE